MPQMGEPVAVAEIDDDDWVCPFEHNKPGKVSNDLVNSSEKLGRWMSSGTSTRLWDDTSGAYQPKKHKDPKSKVRKNDAVKPPHEVYLALDSLGNSMRAPFSLSAHHLIPAEDGLPKSKLLDYVSAGRVIASDIGYGINGRENGLWLPTHHATSMNMPVLPYETQTHVYGDLSSGGNAVFGNFVTRYTQAVMEQTIRQFHDAHHPLQRVRPQVLDKIQSNLATIKNYNCSKCQQAKAGGGKLPPPHKLVYRLNTVSSRPPLCCSEHHSRGARPSTRPTMLAKWRWVINSCGSEAACELLPHAGVPVSTR